MTQPDDDLAPVEPTPDPEPVNPEPEVDDDIDAEELVTSVRSLALKTKSTALKPLQHLVKAYIKQGVAVANGALDLVDNALESLAGDEPKKRKPPEE